MIKGTVEVKKPNEEWKPLSPKDGVPPGSRVRTAANGEADILLAEKSAVRLKPGTEIEVTQNQSINGASKVRVRIDSGRLLNRFDGMPKGSEYHVTTASAVAGIRGTQFEVAADATQTSVRVLKGTVAVENSAGNIEVGERKGTKVAAGQAPTLPQALLQNEIDALLECNVLNFDVALLKTRRIATIAEMRNITTPIELFMTQNGEYPKSLDDAKIGTETDNWGSRYRYEVLNNGKGYIIISNGEDRRPDTEDDLEYRRE